VFDNRYLWAYDRGMARAEGLAVVGDVSALQMAAGLARPVTLAGIRVLPVAPDLAGLLPDGALRRGATLAVSGTGGSTSLTLALVSAASAAGSWCGVVTVPDLGLLAAAEAGLDLARVVLVPEIPPAQWVVVVGALIDSVDVVVVAPPARLRVGDARRLSTRARERDAVLVVLAGRGSDDGKAWAEGVDVRLGVDGGRWLGPDRGHGRLVGRRVEVAVGGRGAAARLRRAAVWLPAPDAGDTAAAAWAGADVEAGIADTGMVDSVGDSLIEAG
jgi:hypothetical protein